MARRYGTVLVFKEDVPKHQIEATLQSISGILESIYVPENPTMRAAGITVPYRLNEYDDKYGDPVWYVP